MRKHSFGDIAGGFYVPISTLCNNIQQRPTASNPIPNTYEVSSAPSSGFLTAQTKMEHHRLKCVFSIFDN